MVYSESVDLGSAIAAGIDTTRACLDQLVVWRELLLGPHSLVIDGWCYFLRKEHAQEG